MVERSLCPAHLWDSVGIPLRVNVAEGVRSLIADTLLAIAVAVVAVTGGMLWNVSTLSKLSAAALLRVVSTMLLLISVVWR